MALFHKKNHKIGIQLLSKTSRPPRELLLVELDIDDIVVKIWIDEAFLRKLEENGVTITKYQYKVV